MLIMNIVLEIDYIEPKLWNRAKNHRFGPKIENCILTLGTSRTY